MFDRPAVYSLKNGFPVADYSGTMGKAIFWQHLAASYRYLPESSDFIQCAASRWRNDSADCMPEVAIRRYQAYWTNLLPEEYEVCCQPCKADQCEEPEMLAQLPLCGFPFGSVDHLPAFLPELQLSLPSGPLRLLQGITDDDLHCSATHCRLRPFFVHDLETRLLWSTALAPRQAVYLDLQPDMQNRRIIDLGAGIGLTCLVLMRRGADVTCTDVDDGALVVSSTNAAAMTAALKSTTVHGVVRVARFNYSSSVASWRRQGVVPPYDVVVMAAAPQGELRKNLAVWSKLFRELGHPGTRVFLEDQGNRKQQASAPPDAETPKAFAKEGLYLVDIFDPLERGLWPLPQGRIYSFVIA
ncbi:unnamed protein product [Effrenium voratum]|uniref:Uncharacterized protein n=1 Tax=Effrenium voratum TaxID=2562239 RepID=A0AA36J104_9DINO|nr:unnamed protein product [Effrenium voratum]CAJ1396534.1 unnamed protein product [Effrenium voratum]